MSDVANNGGITGKGFMPGKSGNPTGRPKVPEELKAKLRSLCPEVVEKWVDIMRNGKDVDALSAAEKIWFATYGKFVQQVENVDETGSTVPNEILIRFVKNK